MARIRPDQPLVPSVLDRLLDFEPEVNREAPRSRNQVLRELKQSVRRDLENLLNTKTRCVPCPPHLEELKQSLLNYGIPDFTSASLVAPNGGYSGERFATVPHASALSCGAGSDQISIA